MSTQTSQRQLDMLHGPIWNKIPQFALPVAATAILEQLFNASDVAVVGNFTGAESTLAVAAVGSNSSIISLIVNLFIGIALGSNVVIAHAIGHGDKASVHKAVHTSIVAAVLGGAAVTISVLTLAAVHTLGISIDIPTALVLCILSAISACGASGVAGGSLLLVPLACSLFGISDAIAMQVVGVGFIVGVIQDSCETAINSSTDVLYTAVAELSQKRKDTAV